MWALGQGLSGVTTDRVAAANTVVSSRYNEYLDYAGDAAEKEKTDVRGVRNEVSVSGDGRRNESPNLRGGGWRRRSETLEEELV